MNPPTAMTRLLGTPRGAAVAYIGIALTVFGWINGAVPWWLGLIALCFTSTVRKSVLELRRYEAWAANWRAMGGYRAPVKPAKKAVGRGTLAVLAAGFFFMACVIWNMTPAGQKTPDGQTLMWWLIMGGFFWSAGKLIGSVRRRAGGMAKATPKARATTKAAPTQADVVEWTLPPASSSPSRLDVIRPLPEYAARLLEERR